MRIPNCLRILYCVDNGRFEGISEDGSSQEARLTNLGAAGGGVAADSSAASNPKMWEEVGTYAVDMTKMDQVFTSYYIYTKTTTVQLYLHCTVRSICTEVSEANNFVDR